MGFLIDLATLPYVVVRNSRAYWQPNARVRALGFVSETLPRDLVAAAARVQHLNEQVAVERKRARQGEDELLPRLKGTVAWLIHDIYTEDPAFTEKAPKTRRGYWQNLNEIEKWAGAFDLRHVTPKAAQKWYRAIYKKTPSKANAIVRVGRILFQFGIIEGEIEDNPFRLVQMTGTKERNIVWPDAAIDTFIDAAIEAGRRSIALAVRFAADTGQREGDILAFPWTGYDGSRIELAQSKRGMPISVRALPSLKAMLDDTPKKGVQVIISEETGRPYKEDNFRHVFADLRAKAGLPAHLWFMDLRRTAVLHLGRGGSTVSEIAQITGHSETTINSLLRRYMPRDSQVADAGIEKLEKYRKRTNQARESETGSFGGPDRV